MENAAKALLISGGVLIAILLLTLFSYLFGKMAESTSSFYDEMEKNKISEFNQQFLNYEGKNLTPQDVATLMNLAQNSEENSNFKAKIVITIDGTTITPDANTWLDGQINQNNKYNCGEVSINDKTLLVDKVVLTTVITP